MNAIQTASQSDNSIPSAQWVSLLPFLTYWLNIFLTDLSTFSRRRKCKFRDKAHIGADLKRHNTCHF